MHQMHCQAFHKNFLHPDAHLSNTPHCSVHSVCMSARHFWQACTSLCAERGTRYGSEPSMKENDRSSCHQLYCVHLFAGNDRIVCAQSKLSRHVAVAHHVSWLHVIAYCIINGVSVCTCYIGCLSPESSAEIACIPGTNTL